VNSVPDDVQTAPQAAPLDKVAQITLTVGRMLLEWGANARTVHQAIADVAAGYGCQSADAFCQHAAIIVTLHRGEHACVQMGKVGEHGVNLRRAQALSNIVDQIAAGALDHKTALEKIHAIPETAPRHPTWLVALSTGIACAAFGRLLGGDWLAFLPIVVGSSAGQWLRYLLSLRHYNVFIIAGMVSFTASFIGGIGSKLAGSHTLDIAMVASVLLLVPGVAVLNAQVDVLEGKPNIGAARALRIAYILVFMTLGLTMAQTLILPTP